VELRAAFTREHALQCGYCTPGMLISARDLVRRLPEPDERSIRVGLSGNLCRCTGYVGIVRAVSSVIEQRRRRGVAAEPGGGRTALGPVGSGNYASISRARTEPKAKAAPQREAAGEIAIADFTPASVVESRFAVAYPPATVFDLFGDVAAVASCLPGVSLNGAPTPDRAEGAIRVKLGPIVADFRGAARIERSPETWSGRIIGIGNDQRSRSSTRGEIRYRLVPVERGTTTHVEISIGYSLRGMLAQIAREGLVRELVTRLTAEFAGNLDRHLSGAVPNGPTKATELNGLSLLAEVLLRRARKLFRRTRG
jgi:aerobic carbon-monoxide dehydrogenase small subunit